MPTVKLTAEQFKNEVFDYTTEKNGNLKGINLQLSISTQTGVAHVKW